jgi:hypothetical protein
MYNENANDPHRQKKWNPLSRILGLILLSNKQDLRQKVQWQVAVGIKSQCIRHFVTSVWRRESAIKLLTAWQQICVHLKELGA